MIVPETEFGCRPLGGWPAWVGSAPYAGAAHPQSEGAPPLARGANCQRYAYAVLSLFDRTLPPHRSSELWSDEKLRHVERHEAMTLDLVLFNRTDVAWGSHVAVIFGSRLLHLCSEVGTPAIWSWADFARRERYSRVVGIVRVPEPIRRPAP